MTTEVISLILKKYNDLQRAIFKKYRIESMMLYDIIHFNILCSKISEQRECELCYSTIKKIIQEVKKMKEEENKNEKV